MGSYRIAWFFYFFVALCHISCLPIFVPFDAQWYIHLASVLGTSAYPGQWDFLRGPLFPALLKFAFWLWGRQATAVFGLQACLAAAGVWLLARVLRQVGRPVVSTVSVVLLALFPNLIAYQHMPMTESGSFFFLALAVCLLAWPTESSLKVALWMGVAFGTGYYFRSSLLYLAPVTGIVYIVCDLRKEPKLPLRSLSSYLTRTSLPQFLAIAVLPFLMAYPWQRNPAITERVGASVLFYGLVTQAVIPLGDPMLGATEPVYARAIEESKINGTLPEQGLTHGRQYAVVDALAPYYSRAGSIFLHLVVADPLRYLAAVERNLVVESGFNGFHYDNEIYRSAVLTQKTSQIEPGIPLFAPLGDAFHRTVADSFTENTLAALAPIYDHLLPFGLVATIIGFGLGLWRFDRAALAFTALPIAFIVAHALLLMSQDRMILPVQPILLVNLIMLPTRLRLPLPRMPGIAFRSWTFGKKRLAVGGVLVALLLIAALALLAPPQRRSSLPPAEAIPNDLGGSIDLVNSVPLSQAQLGVADQPVEVPFGEPVIVRGWLSLGNPTSSSAVDEVDGLLNGRVIKAKVEDRPDVSSAFHNTALGNSGFFLELNQSDLPKGVTRLEILGFTKVDGKYHRFRLPLYLKVR